MSTKLSNSMRLYWQTPAGMERKRKMGERFRKIHTGRKLTPEHRAKVVAATKGVWLGRKHKKSTKRKISAGWHKAHAEHMKDPKFLEKLRQAQIRRLASSKGYHSKLEQRAGRLLRLTKICIKRQFRIGNHPYDFACPKRKLLVEVNGCWYHDHRCTSRPKGRKGVARMRDGKWAWLAKKNGYKLLVLWECEEQDWSKILRAVK